MPPVPDGRTVLTGPEALNQLQRPGRGLAVASAAFHTSYESPRAVARRGPPAHQGDGPVRRRDQLPLTRLGGPRPVFQPRQQRRDVHRPRPPTPLPNQLPASRPGHPRRGDDRRLDSPTGTRTASEFTAVIGLGRDPWPSTATCFSPISGLRSTRSARRRRRPAQRADPRQSAREAGQRRGDGCDRPCGRRDWWPGSPGFVPGALMRFLRLEGPNETFARPISVTITNTSSTATTPRRP